MDPELRFEIDFGVCTGHGRCYELAPGVFTEDERGYGQVLNPSLQRDHMKEARSAISNCPERAIRLRRLASRDEAGAARQRVGGASQLE